MGLLGKAVKGRLAKKLGIKKLQKTVNKIERQVTKISSQMPGRKFGSDFGSESTMIGPGTNAPGAEVPQSGEEAAFGEQNTTGVTQGTFGPETLEAANNMFGQTIEGSFDKALTGDPSGDIGNEVADITDSEDTI